MIPRSARAGFFAVVASLAGCSSIGGFTGAVVGATTGVATTNPAVGVVVGIAVQSATDSVFQKIFRDMQTDEQNRIAALAGGMAVGDRQPWDVHHAMPFSDERGEVEVVGEIANALAPCKEVLLSVLDGRPDAPVRRSYITQACRHADGRWRWAAAEPAVRRWGTLQ